MPAGSFNSQPLEGGCRSSLNSVASTALFQLTAARRRLPTPHHVRCAFLCFNSQPLEGGCVFFAVPHIVGFVSTHSRSKAAARTVLCSRGQTAFQLTAARRRLPDLRSRVEALERKFQLTVARRRLLALPSPLRCQMVFQLTAARRRLPAVPPVVVERRGVQLTAARRRLHLITDGTLSLYWFQLTAARRRLPNFEGGDKHLDVFQLTAARRRLRRAGDGAAHHFLVSTHSRPKAAALRRLRPPPRSSRFNSQPPEGGCVRWRLPLKMALWFQLTAARRRLLYCAEISG